jgi:hypothetical protein
MAERASPNSRARAARAAPEAGQTEEGAFEIRIRMLPGLTPAEELSFEQGLASFLQAHDLLADGTQLQMTIDSASRPLSTTDQVDFVAWLMLSMPVASVHIVGTPSPVKQGQVVFRALRSDLALGPVLALYRLGRLRAEHVVDVLGA